MSRDNPYAKHPGYEEYGRDRPLLAWLFIVLFSAFIVGWMFLAMALIPETDAQWDFGQLPQTPGSSEITIAETEDDAPPPPQLHPWPKAEPPEDGLKVPEHD